VCVLQVLGVLCHDGIIRFIDISTYAQLFDVGRLDDRVCNFVVASSGRHIVAVMDSGSINIYNAHALAKQLNQVMVARILIAVITVYLLIFIIKLYVEVSNKMLILLRMHWLRRGVSET